MKTIYLQTNGKVNMTYASVYKKTGDFQRVFAKKLEDNIYCVDVDEELDDYVIFEDGENHKTDTLYVNGLENKFYYNFNRIVKRYTTYIYDEKENIGKVHSLSIKDKGNLKLLGGSKKIWIYTPSNYNENEKYGVIIAFDGQNAFYKNGYYKNNWWGGVQLDDFAEKLIDTYNKQYIIVGIDNGTPKRDEELTMSASFGRPYLKGLDKDSLGFYHGKLDNVLDFINMKVLPYVKKNYSIDEGDIGVYGASSGGLAAYYACFKYPQIYKFCLCLSPAFHIFNVKDFERFMNNSIEQNKLYPSIYMYVGAVSILEHELNTATKGVYNMMVRNSYPKDKLYFRVNNRACHNEASWRMAINEGLNFLFKK